MSRQLPELQTVLQGLIGEHHKLLARIEAHHAAMKALNLPAMEAARSQQEDIRLRIMSLDQQRKALVNQIGLSVRQQNLTISKIAELFPKESARLLQLRDELRSAIDKATHANHIGGRLAGSVLGHLNTVARILTRAVQPSGVYTKQGVPRVASRIGVIEAVG